MSMLPGSDVITHTYHLPTREGKKYQEDKSFGSPESTTHFGFPKGAADGQQILIL